MRIAVLGLIPLCLVGKLSAQAGLPRPIRAELTADFPGWAFAKLSAEYGRSVPRGASPAWISGDFDGDGRLDYAVQIVDARTREDSSQHVLAFLRRGARYRGIPLQAFPPSRVAYLLRAPRGGERTDFDADPNGARRIRLKHDALEVIFAEAGALTCLYERTGFRCITTGD